MHPKLLSRDASCKSCLRCSLLSAVFVVLALLYDLNKLMTYRRTRVLQGTLPRRERSRQRCAYTAHRFSDQQSYSTQIGTDTLLLLLL